MSVLIRQRKERKEKGMEICFYEISTIKIILRTQSSYFPRNIKV